MFMVMVKLENLSKGYIVTLCLLIIIDYASKIIALNQINKPLPGYKPSKPVVFCGLFPVDSS